MFLCIAKYTLVRNSCNSSLKSNKFLNFFRFAQVVLRNLMQIVSLGFCLRTKSQNCRLRSKFKYFQDRNQIMARTRVFDTIEFIFLSFLRKPRARKLLYLRPHKINGPRGGSKRRGSTTKKAKFETSITDKTVQRNCDKKKVPVLYSHEYYTKNIEKARKQ